MTPLHALAAAAGLHVAWEDADSVPRTVSDDSLRAILSALGHPCATPADCIDSRTRLAAQPAPGFLTAEVGRPIALDRNGPARLVLESGGVRDVPANAPLIVAEPGYHALHLADRRVTLAVAPAAACPIPAGRPWGVALQLYALRGQGAFGDFADLASFARDLGGMGADALAISPVHALFTGDPTRFSPYSPSSRAWLNPWFADAGPGPAGGDLIDWPSAVADKLARLRARFAAERDDPALARFVAAHGPALADHALFEALHAHFAVRGWQDWPAAFHDPASPEVAAFAAAHADEVAFHAFLQWRADADLAAAHAAARGAGMRIGLIADMAVGLDPGGSHAWSRRGDLLTGLSLGAPPDPLGPAGQGWGITGFDPAGLRRTGFAPFIATLRSALAHAGGVRIDHALGLGRLWVIPDGAASVDGAYLAMPLADMLRLIALESHRAGAIVIGEDLGTVPPGFRNTLSAHGLPGMRVLWFERDRAGRFTDPAGWGEQAVAMTGTHDTPTVAGWWRGRDLEWQARLHPAADPAPAIAARAKDRAALWSVIGEGDPPIDPEPVIDAAVAHVARASCALTIFPVEDLIGLEEAPNLPGTVAEHPNWRRRLSEQPLNGPQTRTRIATIARERAS